MKKSKTLHRSNTDKVIGGVSGGLSNYLDIDTVLIRIAFVLLALFGGGGVLIYIILWIVMPAENLFVGTAEIIEEEEDEVPDGEKDRRRANTSLIAGIILIAIGAILVLDKLIPLYHIHDFWPLVLIFAGIAIMKPDMFKPSKKLNHENQ